MKAKIRTADVVIVGGGIHGCSVALQVVRRGLKTIVLEKDYVARHASGVNAGGVRRLGRDLAEVPIAQASWELWQDMPGLVNDGCGYRSSRYLKVARNNEELQQARIRVKELHALGFKHEEVIDRETLSEFMPAVNENCVGALHVEGDGAAQPFRTTIAFKRRAQEFGAVIEQGMPVISLGRKGNNWLVKTPSGNFEAPVIINAAGAWGGRIAGWLGDKIPLEAHAPMLAITERMHRFVDPVVGTLGEALSFKQLDNGTVLIGGGVRGVASLDNNSTKLDMAGLSRFLRTAQDVFPVMRNANVVRMWAGIEGYTRDNLPVIGKGSESGVFHAFGFSAHGFQLAPAIGFTVSHLVMGETPNLPIKPFAIERFQV